METLLSIAGIGLQIVGIVAAADLVAGFVHWIEDAYFTEETPVIGPLFIQPNIVHHHFPRYFTKFGWWKSSRESLMAGVLLLAIASVLGILGWQLVLFVAVVVNGNEIHKWAHRTRSENGPVISWLQDMKIVQTPRQHAVHHTDPKNTYYCPITNFVNPVLETIRFWPALEWAIEKLTGVKHRQDTAVRGQGPGPSWLAEYRPLSSGSPAHPDGTSISASDRPPATPPSTPAKGPGCRGDCAACQAARRRQTCQAQKRAA